MEIKQRINAFVDLGDKIRSIGVSELEEIQFRAAAQNGWFTIDNVKRALNGVSSYLVKDKLEEWVEGLNESTQVPKDVGVVMAGNLPLVGFHDLMCVLIVGHKISIKPSSKDTFLIKKVTSWLVEICPDFASFISYPERLNHVDAIIATGSDNSARYFEQYFKAKPRIIRKNRTSVAVLSGNENAEQIKKLGSDIYAYFGLGCRNISKVLFPKGFDIRDIFPHFESFKENLDCHKYQNNYDYNKSIYLINGVDHYDTGFMLFKKDEAFVSPISVVFYDEYKSEKELDRYLDKHREKIQCVVSDMYEREYSVPLGQAQCPQLTDYADGVNTLAFLQSL